MKHEREQNEGTERIHYIWRPLPVKKDVISTNIPRQFSEDHIGNPAKSSNKLNSKAGEINNTLVKYDKKQYYICLNSKPDENVLMTIIISNQRLFHWD